MIMRKIALLVVLASLTGILFSGCVTSPARKTAWEYEVIQTSPGYTSFLPQLNALGKDGWSVVAMTPKEDQPTIVTVVLKRPAH